MTRVLYFIVILGSFVLLYGVGRAWKLKPETPYDHSLYNGEIAVLTIQGAGDVWLARNKHDCYSLNIAMARRDAPHLRGCQDAHTAFPLPSGTLVKVLSTSVSRKQVRVLDGPLAGTTGWVEFNYLRPRRPGEFHQ